MMHHDSVIAAAICAVTIKRICHGKGLVSCVDWCIAFTVSLWLFWHTQGHQLMPALLL